MRREVWESGDVGDRAERCGRVEMWGIVRRGVGEWKCGGSCGEVWESGDVVRRPRIVRRRVGGLTE